MAIDLKFIKKPSKVVAQDDLSLIANYQKTGDLELLGTLYQKYMHLVFGVCFNYFKDEELSKDAVMQIFEELVVKLKVYQVANFKSWLHMLVRNHCLMAIRKQSKQIDSLEDYFMENDNFVHLDIEREQDPKLKLMQHCLEKLPEKQRKSVNLFYLQEKCYKEVADITGYDVLKIKSYIQNGKRNLKICMERKGDA